jgi:hypothetical protein
MPIQYINRKGKIYYVHQGKTKTGKPKYYLSMKSEGNLVDSMPPEFEIYENPINAHVVLRRCLPKLITDDEINIVEQGLKKLTKLDHYIIDCKKNIISIYTVDQDVEALRETLELYNQNQQKDLSIEDLLKQTLSYSEHLQFILEDHEKRIFITKRYCYLGSIDDWIEIGSPDTLENQVKKYVKHLGQDSYFELI